MKVYIATRLESVQKYAEVRAALNDIGVSITYDWTSHGPVWRSGENRIRQVSLNETEGVQIAGAVIVILPGGRGTHCELGMAIAFGRQIFILAENPKEQEMQGATPETCAFYHHPAVIWTYTIPHLMNYISKMKRDESGD